MIYSHHAGCVQWIMRQQPQWALFIELPSCFRAKLDRFYVNVTIRKSFLSFFSFFINTISKQFSFTFAISIKYYIGIEFISFVKTYMSICLRDKFTSADCIRSITPFAWVANNVECPRLEESSILRFSYPDITIARQLFTSNWTENRKTFPSQSLISLHIREYWLRKRG